MSNPIRIFTDGACSGNPGPMGVGIVILDGTSRREFTQYLGQGTNNIAELTAIELALKHLSKTQKQSPIELYTDSAYAIGVLAQGFKAKANKELVENLRIKLKAFPHLRFVKVAGHAGVVENERCDELARQAVSQH